MGDPLGRGPQLDAAVTAMTDGADGCWPFWVPTAEAEIGDALSLVDLRPGDRFLDLGCGDGRVAAAAARRGAHVRGLELDAALVEQARENLRPWSDRAIVEQVDIETARLDADVIYAYLSPATLQRLVPRLLAAPRASRLVTPWFPVPGWVPSARRNHCWLYRLPAAAARPLGAPGWASSGLLCLIKPDTEFLSDIELCHPGGAVEVGISSSLGKLVSVRTGADHLPSPGALAVDLRWRPRPVGTVGRGVLSAPGIGDLQVLAVWHPVRRGTWRLSAESCRRFGELLPRS